MNKNINVTLYKGSEPLLVAMDIHKEIKAALQMKVNLPSGGYLFIQTTEALTVIDVNSGKFTNSATQDETILKTNIEAVHEIARQLRLRNIGGMIIIDFIDMTNRIDKLAMMEELELAVESDKAKPQVGQLSDLGLVEMTRHRQGQAISEIFAKRCPHCQGNGYIMEDIKFASATSEGEYRAKAAKIKLPMNDRKKFPNNKFNKNDKKQQNAINEGVNESGNGLLNQEQELLEHTENPSIAAQEINKDIIETEEKVTPTVVEIAEEKPAKKQKGRGRNTKKKIQESDVKTDAEIASTVIQDGAEIAPVIEKKSKKEDNKLEPAVVSSTEATPVVKEESSEEKVTKRSRRPNRNSQKRTKRNTKKNVEE